MNATENQLNNLATLERLAVAKGVTVVFLQQLGLRESNGGVLIPYFSTRQRLRTSVSAKEGSKWLPFDGGPSPDPYGAWRLNEAIKVGYLFLVEGESDTWTLWYHNFPALGIPGANMAHTLQRHHIEGIKRLYVVQEADQGGEAFIKSITQRLKELRWEGDAFVIKMPL